MKEPTRNYIKYIKCRLCGGHYWKEGPVVFGTHVYQCTGCGKVDVE